MQPMEKLLSREELRIIYPKIKVSDISHRMLVLHTSIHMKFNFTVAQITYPFNSSLYVFLLGIG